MIDRADPASWKSFQYPGGSDVQENHGAGDLGHLQNLQKALQTAADLSRHYDAPICYVSVASAAPGSVAHNPKEFGDKLGAFASSQAEAHGIRTTSMPLISHDPSVDLDDTLIRGIADSGSDLVVMGSHIPGLPDHFFASNAGYVASHAKVSVMVIR
ncbi:MAG: universal stress protein [Geminicoccaceae bacterium]